MSCRKKTILKTEELDFLQTLVRDVSEVEERESTPPASPAKKRNTPQRKAPNDTEQAQGPRDLDGGDESDEGPFVKKTKSKDGLSKMRISALVEED